VFEGLGKDGAEVAVKVFDPDFIAQHGGEKQIERIRRQLTLKGKHHDNLIDILDGGECSATGYHFIVMPLLGCESLDKIIASFSRSCIRPIISQVAAAAEFLESLGAYHRDIKPANVAVLGSAFEKAILLDLGVVLPLGLAELTH
jgi:serine/threonine protein kinase